MPERIDYWGIPHTWGSPDIFVYPIISLACLIMLIRFYYFARLWWRVGRSEKRWDRLDIRLGRLIKYAIIQIKVLWERYPGIMHIGLAWGFFAFFMGTALATIDSHFIKILSCCFNNHKYLFCSIYFPLPPEERTHSFNYIGAGD